jgi:hypothetical protein
MYPFRWTYTYVPMLSWNLVELVEAPGTFIMGCHGRHRHFIERVRTYIFCSYLDQIFSLNYGKSIIFFFMVMLNFKTSLFISLCVNLLQEMLYIINFIDNAISVWFKMINLTGIYWLNKSKCNLLVIKCKYDTL